ncbi:hypothetical protein C0992_012901 [Termitomyces sp. T32_za158]|nr:hypothetical protein C0992_012901 [Termitomyces sp. T32_za158]
MPEEPALGTDTETSGNSSDKEYSLFSGVLDNFMFKNFNFGKSSISTAKETFERSLRLNISREARHDEPFPTDILPDPIEPTSLALKIQSLLKVLPLPSRSAFKSPKDLKQPEHDDNGCPISSHDQIDEASLVAMLQNETVMNGVRLGDDVRVSVWSALESLEEEMDEKDVHVAGDEDSRLMEDDVRQMSGIMMYSPLTPTNLSLVELAESGVFDPEEQIVDTTSDTARVAGWMGMWPFSVWSTSVVSGPDTLLTASPAPSIATSLPFSPGSRTAQARKRVWIPSSTQLSFQAVWWGYRMSVSV